MPTLTLGDIDRKVRVRLEENTLFYTTEERYQSINEALSFMNLFTGYYQTRVSVTTTEDPVLIPPGTIKGRVIYPVPSPVFLPTDVYFENKPLRKSSLRSTGQLYPDWIRGTPGQEPMYWVPIGVTLFGLVPVPRFSGLALEVEGIANPPAVLDDDQNTLLEDEWMDAVVDYSFMTLVLDEGGKVFADASRLYPTLQKQVKECAFVQQMNWPRYNLDVEQPK